MRGRGKALGGIALVAASLAILMTASGGAASPEQRGAPATSFTYYDTLLSLDESLQAESDCVFGDVKYGVGGGVMLPFEKKPSKILDSRPVNPFTDAGGWAVMASGKGAADPTPIRLWEICSAITTKLRTARFAVPADGKAHSKTVSCGRNERVLSGGASNGGGGDTPSTADRSIVESYPVDGPDSGKGRGDAWRVTLRSSKSFKKKATVAAFCVKSDKMLVNYRHLDFVARSGDFAGVYVSCEEPEQVAGGGVQLDDPKKGIAITTSAPFDSGNDPDSEPQNRWATAVDGPNHGKTDARNWAVCATVPV